MKPVIIFVDDEPHNLTVFEAALPSDWEIHCYDSPLKALDQITKLKPWVVVSDQRMPGMAGVNFLEIIKKTHPFAKRVLVTGYSEEDLVVDSIRKAGVHDYIRKPWDVDDLCHRITQMVDTYRLEIELNEKQAQLEKQNSELKDLTNLLQTAKLKEEEMRKELESWAPPFILKAIHEDKILFPIKKDLAAITFDIIDSSKYHDTYVDGRPIRAVVLEAFSEAVIKNGGWRESHSGDSAYGHFGIINQDEKPSESALAAATEFRVFLRNLSIKHSIPIECGIGLHIAKDVLINVHKVEISTKKGIVLQKSFDTTSSDVDLVHRIENFIHILPGSNVCMSEQFINSLSTPLTGLIELGHFKLKGQKNTTKLFLKPSDKATPELIRHLQDQSVSIEKKPDAAA